MQSVDHQPCDLLENPVEAAMRQVGDIRRHVDTGHREASSLYDEAMYSLGTDCLTAEDVSTQHLLARQVLELASLEASLPTYGEEDVPALRDALDEDRRILEEFRSTRRVWSDTGKGRQFAIMVLNRAERARESLQLNQKVSSLLRPDIAA